MRTTYAVFLCVLILLFSACAQKINDPADVQAIKKSCEDYSKACVAKDANAVAALMTDKAVFSDPNVPVAVGKEVIQKYHQGVFDQVDFEFGFPVADVQVAGDLGVARGSYTLKLIPKAAGLAPSSVSGSWTAVLKRQGDGTWKWDSAISNSDQPAPGSTASGEDEQALLQLERDWSEAFVKKDVATLDRIMANEFQANWPAFVGNKKQYLDLVKGGTAKAQSSANSEMKAFVLGDVAIVHGLVTEQSSVAGKDSSGQYRYTDVFVKRDGRWQGVTGYSAKVQ
jgi:ketosteroid isomerase-like protein